MRVKGFPCSCVWASSQMKGQNRICLVAMTDAQQEGPEDGQPLP